MSRFDDGPRLGSLTTAEIEARGGLFISIDREFYTYGRGAPRSAEVITPGGDRVTLVGCRCSGSDHWHLAARPVSEPWPGRG